MAHLSEDKNLIKAFVDDKDVILKLLLKFSI